MSPVQYLEPFPDLLTSQIGECILLLLKACGAQDLVQIYTEVAEQVVGARRSNVVAISNQAIAVLLDNQLIEKQECESLEGLMEIYCDLTEGENDVNSRN